MAARRRVVLATLLVVTTGAGLLACHDAATDPTRKFDRAHGVNKTLLCDDGPCQTGRPEIDAASTQSSLQSLWTQSNYSPITPQNQRYETGGWILQNGDGSYSFQAFKATPQPCGLDVSEPKPANAVAWVHVHPWSIGEKQISCGYATYIGGRGFYNTYSGDASGDDFDTARTWGIPGYILDADGIRRFTGTDAGTRYARCAY